METERLFGDGLEVGEVGDVRLVGEAGRADDGVDLVLRAAEDGRVVD